jgi:hypothetical protein
MTRQGKSHAEAAERLRGVSFGKWPVEGKSDVCSTRQGEVKAPPHPQKTWDIAVA